MPSRCFFVTSPALTAVTATQLGTQLIKDITVRDILLNFSVNSFDLVYLPFPFTLNQINVEIKI